MTPGVLAKQMGFRSLKGVPGSFYTERASLFDGSPVAIIMKLSSAKERGSYAFFLQADGGAVAIGGLGPRSRIETSITTILIVHEAHQLRKEPP